MGEAKAKYVISAPDSSPHFHAIFVDGLPTFVLPAKGFLDACPSCSYPYVLHLTDGDSTPHFCLRCHHVWYECYWEERG